MTHPVVERIRNQRVIAILRLADGEALVSAAQAVVEGGLSTVEFAFNGEPVLEALRAARDLLPEDCVLGVGTVLDGPTARRCIDAGARFIVSPAFKPEVVELCREANVGSIPGAATPTEILQAWEAGADLVKVFPAAVYGPRFFRDLQGPLPHIPLVAVGGVTLENAGSFLEAGAVAVGIGSGLVGSGLSRTSDWGAVTGSVRKLVDRLGASQGAVAG